MGGLKKYGLDYDSLKSVNPSVIYCSITGFGQTGPYAPRAGYDFLIQGLGGLMSFTGRPDDEPGGGPMKVGVALTDIMTGRRSPRRSRLKPSSAGKLSSSRRTGATRIRASILPSPLAVHLVVP